MGKGKRPSNALNKGASGRKVHGPKTHIHHAASPKALRMLLAEKKVLTKYNDYDSWKVAVTARGGRNIAYDEYQKFQDLSHEKKKAYFDQIRKK